MNESPVAPAPIIETPVYDPRAFVLHWENEAYLKGKRPTPYLRDGGEEAGLVAFMALAGFFCLMGGVWMIFSGGGQVVMLVAGVVLLLAGFGGVGVMVWAVDPTRQNAKRTGRLLVGQIVEAEKIRIQTGTGHRESIGVRYEFTTLTGKKIRNRAETVIEYQQEKMAPAPGSPVYIWYDGEGNYTLL
jgi:hypothetical protein